MFQHWMRKLFCWVTQVSINLVEKLISEIPCLREMFSREVFFYCFFMHSEILRMNQLYLTKGQPVRS